MTSRAESQHQGLSQAHYGIKALSIDNAVYEKEQDSLKDGSSVRNRENEGVMIDEDYDNNVDMSQLDF